MNHNKLIAGVLIFLLSLSITGCGSSNKKIDFGKFDELGHNTTDDFGDTEYYTTEEEPQVTEKEIKITPTEAKQVTLETYQSTDFSMSIPSGWTVSTGSYGMAHSIRVYDPQKPVNQIFVLLKAMPLMHSQSGKDYYTQMYQSYGGDYYVLADAPVLAEPSTENFYKVFSDYATFMESDEPSYSGYTFPRFNNFTTLESFASNTDLSSVSINPAMLRASFSDNSGTEGEGMFTADVIDFSHETGIMYDMYTGTSIDAGIYMAYNIMAVTAEKDTFIEWQDILCECLGTLEYTDSFVDSAIAQSNEGLKTAQQISQAFNQTADSIMASWEARNTSQDIMSQKQSDATLGYERVYDVETNEVYKAPNGWTDYYDGYRYEAVTDDSMYIVPVSGYIDD